MKPKAANLSDPESNEPSLPALRLVGGRNFSTWPDLKWARGNSHARALEASLVQWSASAPVAVTGVLRDDSLAIDFVAHVPRGIPHHEWALLLGDALHNFRSAFDAMAWGLAHFDDTKPSNPKSISFPICLEEKQWERELDGWVGQLDPEFQDRIRVLQPFTYVQSGLHSVLKLIHDLDIQDKHKDVLTVSADIDGLSLAGAFFKYEDPNVSATPRLAMRRDVVLGDGVVLGTLHAGAKIESIGEMTIRPTMRVHLIWQGQPFDVGAMLPLLIEETRRYLDILMFGLAADGPPEGERLPMDFDGAAPASD